MHLDFVFTPLLIMLLEIRVLVGRTYILCASELKMF